MEATKSLVVRYLLAFLFFGHGIAHLPGFLVAWQIRSMPELPYTTMVLGGTVDLGVKGTRALGVALGVLLAAGLRRGWFA